MPSYKDSFGGDSFKAKDQQTGWSVRLTIVSVTQKVFKAKNPGDKDATKLELAFKEDDKTLICNWTNAQEIEKSYGEDTDGWAGKQIQLYRTMVQYGADTVPAIRVRGPNSGSESAPPPKSWGDAPEPERDDPGAAGEADPTADW